MFRSARLRHVILGFHVQSSLLQSFTPMRDPIHGIPLDQTETWNRCPKSRPLAVNHP